MTVEQAQLAFLPVVPLKDVLFKLLSTEAATGFYTSDFAVTSANRHAQQGDCLSAAMQGLPLRYTTQQQQHLARILCHVFVVAYTMLQAKSMEQLAHTAEH